MLPLPSCEALEVARDGRRRAARADGARRDPLGRHPGPPDRHRPRVPRSLIRPLPGDRITEGAARDVSRAMTPIRISGLVATGALLLVPAAASAATVDPAHHEGNPSCSALGYAHGLKFDPPTAGSKSAGGVTVDLSLGTGAFGKLVGWSSSAPVDAVIVKGGPNANVYAYAGGATGDTGLHTPFNGPSKYYGLSHVSFCWDGHVNPPSDDPPSDDPPRGQPAAPRSAVRSQPAVGRSARDDPPADNPPADDPPAGHAARRHPPADTPPADTPPAVVPPASTPAVVTPPATQVLAKAIRSGRSRMRGTSGCAGRMVKARVERTPDREGRVPPRRPHRQDDARRRLVLRPLRDDRLRPPSHRGPRDLQGRLGHAPAHPRADVPALRAADARAAVHRLSSRTGGRRAAAARTLRGCRSTSSRCSRPGSTGSAGSATSPTRSTLGSSLECVDYRAHTPLKAGQVDDTPFGGGAGMVLRVDVVEAALRARYGEDPVGVRSSAPRDRAHARRPGARRRASSRSSPARRR